ncbi:ARF guanine-nucleotide exchange factor GNOM-like, partial [Trifolium medium]|nr:ARF guanine-nucleotide exchange factor GNOM-like [Trifolium medium]
MLQDIGEMWLRLVQGLRKVCLDQREEVRNHALLSLQKCMTEAVETRLPCDLWLQCFDQVIFTLLDDLLDIAEEHSPKDYRNIEETLILAMKLLFKVFLQLLQELSQLETFSKLWVGVLSHAENYVKAKVRGRRIEKLQFIVPELLKNTLVVMKSRGILVENSDLWELTWLHMKNIVPSLQSEVLQEQLDQKQIETVAKLEHDSNISVPSNETLGQDGAVII